MLGTGGTIAGIAANVMDTTHYSAAELDVDHLVAALPEVAGLARFTTEQFLSLDSKDMQPADWLKLAERLRELINGASTPDGIVITHGTDTIEETAFFLSLTLPRRIPIVMTAAMRPASARSADGPMNLLQAISAATNPSLATFGPLVAANDRLWRARDVTKRHTHAPDALGGIETAPIAMATGTTWWLSPHPPTQAVDAPFNGRLPAALPEVWILHGHAGAPAALIDFAVEHGVRGLVLALAGHGSVPISWEPAITRALAAGVTVVRASRIRAGAVMANANYDDTARGTIASIALSPLQARIMLALTLADSAPRNALQSLFARN